MLLPEIFKDAKVGDEVFSATKGWGKIAGIASDEYPIRFEANGWKDACKFDGRVYIQDAAPTCWPAHLVPQYYLDLCPRPKRKVAKEVKGYLVLSPRGCVIAFTHCVSDVEPGYIPVPVTGTYEVEE